MKKAEGALVAEAQANGPAAKAGIESGDIITAVNGTSVKDARELARTIGTLAPGTAVKLERAAQGQGRGDQPDLGELPNTQQANADAGHETDMATPRLDGGAGKLGGRGRQQRRRRDRRRPERPGRRRGFKEGDVILEVAGKSVGKPAEVSDAIKSAQAENKGTVLMRVRSGDASRYVAVPLGRTAKPQRRRRKMDRRPREGPPIFFTEPHCVIASAAKQSEATSENWIASSQELLAMTR